MHCQSEKFIVLSSCKDGYVGICSCCKEFNLAYQNLIFSFSEKGILNFYKWMQNNKDNTGYQFDMPHDRNFVFKGPADNFYIALKTEEINILLDLVEESMIIYEAKKILDFD